MNDTIFKLNFQTKMNAQLELQRVPVQQDLSTALPTATTPLAVISVSAQMDTVWLQLMAKSAPVSPLSSYLIYSL